MVFEAKVTDQDGVANARANLGVFAPLGAQTGWVNMYDNGINGDRVPGDGIYSVELSLRPSTPLGTHERTREDWKCGSTQKQVGRCRVPRTGKMSRDRPAGATGFSQKT